MQLMQKTQIIRLSTSMSVIIISLHSSLTKGLESWQILLAAPSSILQLIRKEGKKLKKIFILLLCGFLFYQSLKDFRPEFSSLSFLVERMKVVIKECLNQNSTSLISLDEVHDQTKLLCLNSSRIKDDDGEELRNLWIQRKWGFDSLFFRKKD